MPCVITQSFANGPQFSVAEPNVSVIGYRHHGQTGGGADHRRLGDRRVEACRRLRTGATCAMVRWIQA